MNYELTTIDFYKSNLNRECNNSVGVIIWKSAR